MENFSIGDKSSQSAAGDKLLNLILKSINRRFLQFLFWSCRFLLFGFFHRLGFGLHALYPLYFRLAFSFDFGFGFYFDFLFFHMIDFELFLSTNLWISLSNCSESAMSPAASAPFKPRSFRFNSLSSKELSMRDRQ